MLHARVRPVDFPLKRMLHRAPMKVGALRGKVLGWLSAGFVLAGLAWVLLPNNSDEADQETSSAAGGSTGETSEPQRMTPMPGATYVGSAACGSCHQEQAKAYRGSHHDRAIEVPSDASVLAPFGGESFRHDGITTTFLRKDAANKQASGGTSGEEESTEFFVRTVGAEGKVEEFPVAYTFGVEPLQQYLLDVGGGRLQALTVAWDSRTSEQGGQRYFDLYPGEDLEPLDEIHWTRGAQNWNFACADCHTTALHKGYDAAKDTFDPSWSDLNVGCEACHGPGSNHVSWAQDSSSNSERGAQKAGADSKVNSYEVGLVVPLERVNWALPPGARNVIPRSGEENVTEVETCAPCHSRRQQLREGRTPDQPYMDAYVPELLMEGLYYADGQIHDEVYVYGSFLQSRMFHAGVRCNDCHEPHSLKLRREGNALCSECHSAQVYDVAEHHHHSANPGSEVQAGANDGTACVDCHMPMTTYMRVDPRRDHSLRIPRPDLSATTGAPDACTNCHEGKEASWAADAIEQWFGPERRHHYATTFQAARNGDPAAEAQLIHLAASASFPAIVRGTALLLLANFPSENSVKALSAGSQSSEALIRLGVTRGVLGLPPEQRLKVTLPLIADPLLAIRIEATRALVGVPLTTLTAPQTAELNKAFVELEKVEHFYDDRPDAWLRLALLELGRGKADAAAEALERALKLDARFTPALVNLADLRRSQGNEAEATSLLRRAVEVDAQNAEAWYALGLSLVRTQKLSEAMPMLERAAALRPDNSRFAYVHAVALADAGQLPAAVRAVQKGLEHNPHDRTLLQALMNYAKAAGDRQLASEAAARLAGVGQP